MSSELAQKATWSPEEFEPYVPPKVELTEVKFPEPEQAQDAENSFSLPKSFWEDLWKDPVLSTEFEKYIDDRVNMQVKGALETGRAIAYEEGFQEGKQNGLEVGRAEGRDEAYREAKQAHPLLQKAIDEIIREKQNLIHEHEREWAQALVHVVNKLQVKEPDLFANGIKKWVADRLIDFPNYSRIRIFVSKNDYEKISLLVKAEDIQNCEVLVDVDLEKGQIRCDCGEGGVFFTKSDGFKLLDQFLEENFHTK